MGHYITIIVIPVIRSSLHIILPDEDDDVFFDVNSFSLDEQTVTLDVNANCKNINWTDVTNMPLFYSAGYSTQNTLNVYGSFTFSLAMYKDLHRISMYSDDLGNTITTGETNLGYNSSLIFEGSASGH